MGMTDDEKTAFDVTSLILDRIKKEVDFSEVDPFTMKYLREEIQRILLKNIDLAEERFEQAFQEGESKGFEDGKYDTVGKLRDKIQRFLDDEL